MEEKFKGSVLFTEINNKPSEMLFKYIKMAYNKKPNSLFWQEAFNHIKTKLKIK